MDHSITFRNGDESYNTFDDWHLIAPSRPSIAPAQPKSNYVDILGANGSLDFSEALVGNPTYSDREGSWEFVVLNPGDVDQYSLFDAEDCGRYRWQKIYDKIQAAIHGRTFEVILDDDPERMYKGRLWMNEWRSNAGWSRIVINYRLRPYKYDLDGNIVWPEYAVGYDEDGSGDGGHDDENAIKIITNPPLMVTAEVGETVTLDVVAEGYNLSYSWEYNDGSSGDYIKSDDPGYSTNSLTLHITEAMNGREYRCIVIDGNGKWKNTTGCYINVGSSGGGSSEDDAGVIHMQDLVFAEGMDYMYVTSPLITLENLPTGMKHVPLHVRISYTPSTNTTSMSTDVTYWNDELGINKTSTITDTVDNKLTADVVSNDNGSNKCQFMVLFSAKRSTTSGTETITDITIEYWYDLNDESSGSDTITITQQPSSATAVRGDTVRFEVNATGEDLTYRWQWNTGSGTAGSDTWTFFDSNVYPNNTAVSVGGYNSRQLVLSNVTPAISGHRYRCVVFSGSDGIASDSATLTVVESTATITQQPVDRTVTAGDSTRFFVVVDAHDPSYQWQSQRPWSSNWMDVVDGSTYSGANSNILRVNTSQDASDFDGMKYRCVITDDDGMITSSVTSDYATLTVNASTPTTSVVTITKQPTSKTVTDGDTVQFSVTANSTASGSLSYQWQYSTNNGSSYSNLRNGTVMNATVNGATGSTLFITTPAGSFVWNGVKLRCIVTDSLGAYTTTNEVYLYVS